MFTSSALAALLLASAAVTARAASPYSRRMEFCGRQACLPPNRCQNVDGVSVCVRTEPPTCAGSYCESGFKCALMQDVCASLPCHPKPYCVKTNPCGKCSSPDNFCQLLPTPVCRPIIQPTCENKVCASGEICSEVPDNICLKPPCLPKLICTDVATWYQVATGLVDGLSGKKGSRGISKAEELRLKLSGSSGSDKNSSQPEEDD